MQCIDISRQFYVDRISDTIASVKTEKTQIDSTITDIKDLKEFISKTVASIQTSDAEVEELVFKVAGIGDRLGRPEG